MFHCVLDKVKTLREQNENLSYYHFWLTNWINFRIPGMVWKYPILNLTQLRAPCGCAAGFGWACLLGSTVTTVSDIMSLCSTKRSLRNSYMDSLPLEDWKCFSQKNYSVTTQLWMNFSLTQLHKSKILKRCTNQQPVKKYTKHR